MKDWLGGKWVHEARLRLSGNRDAAKRLVGYGRQLVGHLRDLASHGGSTVQVIRKKLPDGSLVVARLINGQAIIEVFAAATSGGESASFCTIVLTLKSDTALLGWDRYGAVIPMVGDKIDTYPHTALAPSSEGIASTAVKVIDDLRLGHYHIWYADGVARVSTPFFSIYENDATAWFSVYPASAASEHSITHPNIGLYREYMVLGKYLFADNYVLYPSAPANRVICGCIRDGYYVALCADATGATVNEFHIQTFSLETGAFVGSTAVPYALFAVPSSTAVCLGFGPDSKVSFRSSMSSAPSASWRSILSFDIAPDGSAINIATQFNSFVSENPIAVARDSLNFQSSIYIHLSGAISRMRREHAYGPDGYISTTLFNKGVLATLGGAIDESESLCCLFSEDGVYIARLLDSGLPPALIHTFATVSPAETVVSKRAVYFISACPTLQIGFLIVGYYAVDIYSVQHFQQKAFIVDLKQINTYDALDPLAQPFWIDATSVFPQATTFTPAATFRSA